MLEYKQNTNIRVPVRMLTTTGVAVLGLTYSNVSVGIEKADGTVVTPTLSNSDWTEVTSGAFSQVGNYDLIIPASATNQTGMLRFVVKASGADPFVGVIKIVAAEEADTKTVVDAMRTDYTTARAAKIDTIDTNVSTANTKLTAIDTNIGTANTKLTTIDGKVDANTTKLTTIDGKVDMANTKLTTIDDTTDIISTNLDGLATDVSNANAVLSEVESATSAIQNTVNDIAVDVQLLVLHTTGKWEIKVSGPDANKMIFYAPDGTTILAKYELRDANGNPTFVAPFARVPVA